MSIKWAEGYEDLPRQVGYLRTPFGFYIADRTSPGSLTWTGTVGWLKRKGSLLIPNSYMSYIDGLMPRDLQSIKNPDIREETRKARILMREGFRWKYFVNLMMIGNEVLLEPYGFGLVALPPGRRTYDSVREMVIRSRNEELRSFGAQSDLRFASRYSYFGLPEGRRHVVDFNCDRWSSDMFLVGIGIRFPGNEAFQNPALDGLL